MLLKCNFFAPAAGHHSVLPIWVLCLSTGRLYASIKRWFLSAPAGQNPSVFSFLLVYRAPLDKQKTLNFCPLQAREKMTLEVFTKGISLFFGACDALTHIHLYNVRNVYSKHTRSSSPQGRKLWATIRLYKGRSKVGFRVKKKHKNDWNRLEKRAYPGNSVISRSVKMLDKNTPLLGTRIF